VAVTRARHKLLLLGDARTLAAAEPLARLLGLVRQRGWLLQLPAEAVER
jgi:superfamily I DNA and/or RNA helicase